VIAQVTELLGRTPRGLEDVAAYDAHGVPSVIRVASLVDERPFPTLYWLIDRDLCYRIDQLEASGLIAQFQAQVDADIALQNKLAADHALHIEKRLQFMSSDVRDSLEALGYLDVLQKKGIGGIGDFTRIRCLHTWYGAHRIDPNTIGEMLDAHWRSLNTQQR